VRPENKSAATFVEERSVFILVCGEQGDGFAVLRTACLQLMVCAS
jgi:hypothetical protein